MKEAIKEAKKHKAILLVAKLDRLARSLSFITALQETKVKFRACDMPEANEFMIQILGAVGEYERKLISERTKAGLAQAKKRGVILGNRILIEKGIARKWNKAQVQDAKKHANNMKPIIENIMKTIKGYNGIARELNKRNFRTKTGGLYYPQTVKNIINKF